MNEHKIPWGRIIAILATTAVIIAIISTIIGREVYGKEDPGLIWFGIVHFLGYLFFLIMPVEMAYAYYAPAEESVYLIYSIAILTAIVAQVADYFIGYYFSAGVIKKFIGMRRYIRAKKHIKKYGNTVILVFNLFPLSSPIIALAAGMLKYSWKEWLLYSSLGLLIKYLILSLIF